CSCSPNLTLREQFQRADVVFIGKEIESKKIVEDNVTLVKVEVLRTWKQDLERFVTIKYHHKPGFSFKFEPNFESLLYAYKNDDGTFYAWDCCLATKPLTQAADDLKLFKKWGEEPKKVIEPNSPPNPDRSGLDTSGEGVFVTHLVRPDVWWSKLTQVDQLRRGLDGRRDSTQRFPGNTHT